MKSNTVIVLILAFILNTCTIFGQLGDINGKPKLIVGIVVDQLRFEHLYKYEGKYSDGGIKRLLDEGYNFKNAQFNFIPTETAPGHASIYTGTTPKVNGIIGNSWYDRFLKKEVGNVKDTTYQIVGSDKENLNGISPNNLLTTTISDEIRMSNQFKSKVISISLKDRGAVLPSGFAANGAYWHDAESSEGNFVTSTYYMKRLPNWVKMFNDKKLTNKYLDTVWNTLYPLNSYTESAADDNNFENILRGKNRPIFPYDFKFLRKTYKPLGAEYRILWLSPYGNTLLTDFAKAAIKNESLGKDKNTDLLNISYSVLDVIGHTMGPQSIEYQDAYLRLDRDIENLLNFLDAEVGTNNYLVFFTSDHGALPVSSYLAKNKIKAGIASIPEYKKNLESFLNSVYGGSEWVEHFGYENVYLNKKKIAEAKIDLASFQNTVAEFLYNQDGIVAALTADQLKYREYREGVRGMISRGFNAKRSGDIVITFDSGFNADSQIKVSDVKGTTHGSGFSYDTHVPLLFYGTNIEKGESIRKVSIEDIAPTLSMFLNIRMPSGTTGTPLQELFLKKQQP